MSKTNEKRAAYLLGLCVPEKSVLLLDAESRIAAALDEAERRAYRSLARWAVKRVSQKQRALTVARQAGRSLTAECRQSDVETLRDVADECRRRAKGKA